MLCARLPFDENPRQIIDNALIPFTESDTYARVFVVGLLNTLLVSIVGIVIATIIGVLVALGRLSPRKKSISLHKNGALTVHLARSIRHSCNVVIRFTKKYAPVVIH